MSQKAVIKISKFEFRLWLDKAKVDMFSDIWRNRDQVSLEEKRLVSDFGILHNSRGGLLIALA
tara:strand:+ start:386 stop:574 length:189 start_codon:yes stop_codon:yes gene_type:complete